MNTDTDKLSASPTESLGIGRITCKPEAPLTAEELKDLELKDSEMSDDEEDEEDEDLDSPPLVYNEVIMAVIIKLKMGFTSYNHILFS